MIHLKKSFPTILLTGLVVGVLDALAAIVVYSANPLRMFQFIASGVIGKDAFAGGIVSASWGVLFHFFIAFFWTAVYFILYPVLNFRAIHKVVSGLLYGIIIWLGMNMIVLPISHGAPREIAVSSVTGIVILMVVVGLPISWMASRYYATK